MLIALSVLLDTDEAMLRYMRLDDRPRDCENERHWYTIILSLLFKRSGNL